MPGWFHNLPPQPYQLAQSVAPEDTALGNINLYTGVAPQTIAQIVSSWGQESWSAQTGATVASQLAPAVSIQAPPPTRINSIRNAYIAWNYPSWSLKFPSASVSGVDVIATVPQVPNIPVSALAAVRAAWPEPQWDPQAESTSASIFAAPANLTFNPAPPLAVAQENIYQSWPQPDWIGQSESAIASGLSPAVPPPVGIPSQSLFTALLASGQVWPRETWGSQTAPQTTAWIPPPITAVPEPVPHPELLLWPREDWGSQSGSRVAGQLAVISQQIPPPPAGLLANIQSSWPREQWAAQSGATIASTLAQVVPPTFVNNPPIQQALLNQIIGSWPQPSWAAQTGATVAAQFGQQFTVVVSIPTSQEIQYGYPREDWRAQTGANIAASLAQLQVPALFNPYSTVASQLALVNQWPRDSWSAQQAPQSADWIPPPATATPSPPAHIERLLWQQEQWGAQRGSTFASLLAVANEPQPSPPVQQQIISIWAPETWSAQSGPTVASQLATAINVPFAQAPIQAMEVSSWPTEQWPAQTGVKIAAQLAATPAPAVPSLPASLGQIRFVWPQEDWNAQKGARNAAAFAQAPRPIPFISIPTRTQLVSSWPREEWNAQSAPALAYLGAKIGPPPPPPPPKGTPRRPANLGYKVTTSTYNLLDLVSRSWGGEFRQPDHRVYEFSNGRGFDSTDQGSTGIYRKK